MRDTATKSKEEKKPWFDYNAAKLLPLIRRGDFILHSLNDERQFIETEDGEWIDIGLIQDQRETLRTLKKEIQDQVKIAYENYAQAKAEEISKMPRDPKRWWKAIRELGGDYFAHHRDCKTTALQKKDGTFATTDAENMELWTDHFTRVLNTKRDFDQDVLNDIESKETMDECDLDITEEEFKETLSGMKNDKAGGENGVIPDAIKALKGENPRQLYQFCTQFWKGEIDYESWHKGVLVIVHKAGKDKSNPNSYRGVNLMDVISKLLSRVLNKRLFKILKKHGTPFQFGGTPEMRCRDGIFTLTILLHTRRQHDQASHVVFVDLVKACDTANHELLLLVLKKYGTPPKFVDVIQQLYTDLKVVLKLGKLKTEILQEVGVRQGDNMAPVLFLFLMTAFADIIDVQFARAGILRPEMVRESDATFHKAHMLRHDISKCLKKTKVCFIVNLTIYIINTAIVLSRDFKESLNLWGWKCILASRLVRRHTMRRHTMS